MYYVEVPAILDKILADIGVVLEQITIDTTATITPDKATSLSGTSNKA
jgi:hypothetical protein